MPDFSDSYGFLEITGFSRNDVFFREGTVTLDAIDGRWMRPTTPDFLMLSNPRVPRGSTRGYYLSPFQGLGCTRGDVWSSPEDTQI